MTKIVRLSLCAFAVFLSNLGTSSLAESPLPQRERLESSPVLRHLRPNSGFTPSNHPARSTLDQMYVPDGFAVRLVAAEPELHQPVAFTFDERGRIWVAEALSYPQRREEGKGLDRILILEDREGDGEFETRKIFAEGLNLVSGLEVGFGGVWIGAAPQLLFLADTNRDDRADGPAQVLLEGFGFQDTHECLNSFMWGPDGWLYGNQGVFNYSRIGKRGAADSSRKELRAGVWRYHPIRHEFEVFAEGGSNQWGLDYDENGQIFMTHCRSYWGRGGTTHVIQGGVYWNQANANYPAFVVGDPPSKFPELQNYLLASARYDHGAGGAGERGSDAIYGGHSHVGTMIYLGNNWPETFRGRLFTHNLHGHQINQQINLREGSGFNTIHAGRDVFFCTDPQYVAVDLQYGPDGAVYVIDWHDPQHCHNPNTERWDRTNGRIYRMAYASTYRPAHVDLRARSDEELVELLGHENAWFGRAAIRLFQERASQRPIQAAALSRMTAGASGSEHAGQRLKMIWALHATGGLTESVLVQTMSDSDEWIRAWSVQLACERWQPSKVLEDRLLGMAVRDPSPTVRMYLASAVQRLPDDLALSIADSLVARTTDVSDRNISKLLWHGVADRMPKHFERVWGLATRDSQGIWADWAVAFGVKTEARGLDAALELLSRTEAPHLPRRLASLELALETRSKLPEPRGWRELANRLRAQEDAELNRASDRLSAIFGDASSFSRLRDVLASGTASAAARDHAFEVLHRAEDRGSLTVFLGLLDEMTFRRRAIQALGRFDDPRVGSELLGRLDAMNVEEKFVAMQVLTSRANYAAALLDALGSNRIRRDALNAYHVRQLNLLRSAELDQRLEKYWGRSRQNSKDRSAEIESLLKVYDEAPLWAYDGRAGRTHFQRLCASCHVLKGEGTRIGPDLTGAGANGARYYLENILDPNSVVGADFQMTEIETKQGRLISGVVTQESADSLAIRTATEQLTLRKEEVARRQTSEMSLMPEGLMDSLNPRERIELLKHLTSN